MGTRKIDRGLQVVRHLLKVLALEDDACVKSERGFTWWGENLAQRVWADRVVKGDDGPMWKVHVRTDLLADVRSDANTLGVLTEYAAHSTLGGGLVRDKNPGNGRVQVGACLCITDSTIEWAKGFLPTVAATQAAEAHLVVKDLAAMAGCSPAFSTPPGGPRKRHYVLDVLGMWIRGGREEPVWTVEEFEDTADDIAESAPWGHSLTVTAGGITAQVPFGESTAVCDMTTRNEHPTYRNGMLVRLTLPIILSDTVDPEIVFRCNALELNSITPASHCTGSWYSDEGAFTYSNFIPNLQSFTGAPFLGSMIRLMAARAQWFAETISSGAWPIVPGEDKRQTWMN